MTEYQDRWRCEFCGHICTDDEVLSAPNPFNPEDTLEGCPKCKAVGTLSAACAKEGCEQLGTAGTPTEAGYSFLCYQHYREYRKQQMESERTYQISKKRVRRNKERLKKIVEEIIARGEPQHETSPK